MEFAMNTSLSSGVSHSAKPTDYELPIADMQLKLAMIQAILNDEPVMYRISLRGKVALHVPHGIIACNFFDGRSAYAEEPPLSFPKLFDKEGN